MSSAAIYTTSSLERPLPIQEDFAQNYDLDNPVAAVNNYARVMREHTKRQMETAASSSRRRTQNSESPVSTMGALSKDSSTASDVSSTS